MTAKEKKPRGRPPKRPVGVKRRHFTFRASDALADNLIDAAKREKKSVSEEIETRLERSFDRDRVAAELFGTTEAGELLQAVGLIIKQIDRFIQNNPRVQAKLNDKPVYGLDNALQLSAGIIGLLQAINGQKAEEILDSATSMAARDMKANVWREAAIAAAAQVLGMSLADAAKGVDLGPPPIEGVERYFGKPIQEKAK